MSYDLDIYLTPGPEPLPDPVAGLGWQIAIYPPTRIDPDEIRPELLSAIGSRSHLLNVHLEGAAKAKAEEALFALADSLVANCNAAVHDLQQDSVVTQQGRVELVAPAPKPRAEPLRMEFTYQCPAQKRPAMRARILDILEAVTPKAMPRRYGSYEPMPFTYAENGHAHLLEDWGQGEWFYLWRASAPYQMTYFMAPYVTDSRPPTLQERFEWCTMTIEVSPRILRTKKDKADMLALFAALSEGMSVVYAELLQGGVAHADVTYAGLEARPALACAIGPDYAAHWPEFCNGARRLGAGHYLRDSVCAGDEMVAPPASLIAPSPLDPMNNPLNSKRGQADIYPFEPLS